MGKISKKHVAKCAWNFFGLKIKDDHMGEEEEWRGGKERGWVDQVSEWTI